MFETVGDDFQDLQLLLLLGSRARGDHRDDSDWDFGFLGGQHLDSTALTAWLVEHLHTDRVDLADLQSASGLFRFRAARDGVVAFERDPNVYERFVVESARFWFDASPTLEAGYRDILSDLG